MVSMRTWIGVGRYSGSWSFSAEVAVAVAAFFVTFDELDEPGLSFLRDRQPMLVG